jgi:hypothetical protein
MTPKFQIGDRVKMSAFGLETLKRYPSYRDNPDRIGIIKTIRPTGTGYTVLWDGRSTVDSLHGDYLDLAEEPKE